MQYIDGIIGRIQYFSALHQEDHVTHGTDAWLFSYMAPVYSSAFAPPTTNKIGTMDAMVPAYFSMTHGLYTMVVSVTSAFWSTICNFATICKTPTRGDFYMDRC